MRYYYHIVWLDNLKWAFVIKEIVVHLYWDFSFVIVKKKDK